VTRRYGPNGYGDYPDDDDGVDAPRERKAVREPRQKPRQPKSKRKDNQRAMLIIAVVLALLIVYGVRSGDKFLPFLRDTGHLIACNMQKTCPTPTPPPAPRRGVR
jgi:hypothetical protein